MLTNPSQLVARAKAIVHECDINDAHGCLQSDTLIIDVREPAEYQRGHIPGAANVPRGMLEFEVHGFVERSGVSQDIDAAEQAILLVCASGGRSALAAATMADLGYRNVRSMAGGMVAWTAAELPVDTPG